MQKTTELTHVYLVNGSMLVCVKTSVRGRRHARDALRYAHCVVHKGGHCDKLANDDPCQFITLFDPPI